VQRRLAAILAADVVDYTRLMGEDEAATLAALNQLRTEVFQPSIEAHQGSIIKHMGDGWLVEFPNVAEAVACAVAVQDAMNGHEIMSLRIGVHIGVNTGAKRGQFTGVKRGHFWCYWGRCRRFSR
jgi:adenylate cyclase